MAESLKERLARLAAEKSASTNTVVAPKEQEKVVEDTTAKDLEALAQAEAKAQEVFAQKANLAVDDMDALLDAPMGLTEKHIAEEAAIVTADIVPRIRQLSSLSDAQLESEMKLLKNALMANPEAVALMLPTDVGELVKSLRRITKEAVIADAVKKTSKAKAPKVDAKTMWDVEADDF